MQDISSWQGNILFAVPIGKRSKSTVYDPGNGAEYYFKQPEQKYPWEFWTEVVAYRVGKQLGFDTLEYSPVIRNEFAGCLSPSMVSEFQDLIHGQQYLTRIMPDFDKKKGTDHSFQIVEKLFTENENIAHLFPQFINMLVFDAIIGNHDRHQQNWGIIKTLNFYNKAEQPLKPHGIIDKLIKTLYKLYIIQNKKHEEMLDNIKHVINFKEEYSFSPFFDNGNSLAYNQTENRVEQYLKDTKQLENYLFGNKAHSHIKWHGNEVKYIDLLENIKASYPDFIKKRIEQVAKSFKESSVNQIITEVDRDFPKSHSKYQLTLARKELMYKIILRRTEALLQRLS